MLPANNVTKPPLSHVALLFLRLGFTAFGGPAAHIAMMEDEVVRRRHWLTRERFLDPGGWIIYSGMHFRIFSRLKSVGAGTALPNRRPRTSRLPPLRVLRFRISGRYTGRNGFGQPAFEFNWGALPHLQLHAIVPFGVAAPTDGPISFGFTDMELGQNRVYQRRQIYAADWQLHHVRNFRRQRGSRTGRR